MITFYIRNIDQTQAAHIAGRADALGIGVSALAATILEEFSTRPIADRMRIEQIAVNRQAVTLATMPEKTKAATLARMEASRQATAAALASAMATEADRQRQAEAAQREAEYNLAAAHRLAQLDLLAPRCKWEISEDQADADTSTRLARAQWRSIMAKQTAAEIEMGL